MDKKILSRNYYLLDNDTIDPLYNALDCIEQVKYQLLKSHKYNYAYAFCKDINIYYEENETEHIVTSNNFDDTQDLFLVEEYKQTNKSYIDFINQNIDKGEFLAYTTIFELLPSYTWYNENYVKPLGIHWRHHSLILTQDDSNYYILESPGMINESKNIRYKENREISIIPKEVMHRAFDIHCILRKFYVKEENLNQPMQTMVLMKQMVINYEYEEVIKRDGKLIHIGKTAIDKWLNALKTDDYYKVYVSLFDDHLNTHLMASRLLLLKMCVETDENLIGYKNQEVVLEKLRENEKSFNLLSALILKNIEKGTIINFREKIIDRVEKIQKSMQELFVELKIFVS